MSPITTRPRILALGVVCAVAGAGAGTVAVASASSGQSSTSHARSGQSVSKAPRRGVLGLVRHTVHADLVVHTSKGFQTVTVNRGTVDSVSGDTLTMTDGTRRASDQKVTLTIPSDARVRNDRNSASMSSLRAGEHVLVVQAPARTIVAARPARTTSTSS